MVGKLGKKGNADGQTRPRQVKHRAEQEKKQIRQSRQDDQAKAGKAQVRTGEKMQGKRLDQIEVGKEGIEGKITGCPKSVVT